MYFILSLTANLIGAVFSGVQLARTGAILKNGKEKKQDVPLTFSSGLLAFAIPFFSPISNNLGASVSLFIALSAVSTLVASRSVK